MCEEPAVENRTRQRRAWGGALSLQRLLGIPWAAAGHAQVSDLVSDEVSAPPVDFFSPVPDLQTWEGDFKSGRMYPNVPRTRPYPNHSALLMLKVQHTTSRKRLDSSQMSRCLAKSLRCLKSRVRGVGFRTKSKV